MPGKTGINWTDDTWNPLTGCSECAPECTNCYAMFLAGSDPKLKDSPRYKDLTVIRGDGMPHWTGEVRFWPDVLTFYIRKQAPRLVFTNSMSDPFHPNVLQEWRDKFFAAMLLANWHIFQVLTKRPDAMAAYVNDPETRGRVFAEARRLWEAEFRKPSAKRPEGNPYPAAREVWPAPHIWLGCSAGSQRSAEKYLPQLLEIKPGWLLWVSAEPLIGPMELRPEWIGAAARPGRLDGKKPNTNFIQWIITGGESGARDRARPMRGAWPVAIREACAAAGIAYWEKQPGNWKELLGDERERLLADPDQTGALLDSGDLCCLDPRGRTIRGPRILSELLAGGADTPVFLYSKSKGGESAYRQFPPFPTTFPRAGELSAGRPSVSLPAQEVAPIIADPLSLFGSGA